MVEVSSSLCDPWQQVQADGNPCGRPPVPPSLDTDWQKHGGRVPRLLYWTQTDRHTEDSNPLVVAGERKNILVADHVTSNINLREVNDFIINLRCTVSNIIVLQDWTQ